jgi:hypothetical protein
MCLCTKSHFFPRPVGLFRHVTVMDHLPAWWRWRDSVTCRYSAPNYTASYRRRQFERKRRVYRPIEKPLQSLDWHKYDWDENNTFRLAPDNTFRLSPDNTFRLAPDNTFRLAPNNTFRLAPDNTFRLAPDNTFRLAPDNTFRLAPDNTFRLAPDNTFRLAPDNELVMIIEYHCRN